MVWHLLSDFPAHFIHESARETVTLWGLWILGLAAVAAGGKTAAGADGQRGRVITGIVIVVAGLAVLVANAVWHTTLDARQP